jgi:hypothetical protein
MSSETTVTILEVVHEVLSWSEQPLSAGEIARFARQMGFELDSWEVKTEIEADLQEWGSNSPFTRIGPARYGLFAGSSASAGPAPNPLSPQSLISWLVVLALLALTLYTFNAASTTIASALVPEEEGNIVAAAPATVVDDLLSAMLEAAGGGRLPVENSVETTLSSIDPAWWTANAVNQISADTQAVARQYLSNPYNTCGPTALALVVSYARARAGGAGERVTPADVLSDARNRLGYFIPPYNSGLLEFRHLRDIAGLYGLVHAYPPGQRELLSLEELLEQLRLGRPAIAGMRYRYQGEGARYLPAGGSGLYNHFVVVFGAEVVDGQENLWVQNPHPGKYLYNDAEAGPELMTIEQFRGSWALNDGSEYQDYGRAVFFELGQ